jgi:hypothetical protein
LYRSYQISGTCTYDTNKCNRADCTWKLTCSWYSNHSPTPVNITPNKDLGHKGLYCLIRFHCHTCTSTWYLIAPVQTSMLKYSQETIANDNMKNWEFHTVGTVPQSNIKIVERGKFDTPNTQIHDQ